MNGLLVGLVAFTAAQVFPGSGYNRTLADRSDPRSTCLYWEAGTLTYRLGAGGGATQEMLTAVRKSWQTWSAVFSQCGNLTLQEGPSSADRRIGYDAGTDNNQNVVVFRARSCKEPGVVTGSCEDEECGNLFDCWDYPDGTIALTTSTYSRSSGRVFDSDIEVNAAAFQLTTVDSPPCQGTGQRCTCPIGSSACVLTDVQNTMTHEVGHVLGLDHVTDESSTMYQSAEPGETAKRTLDVGSQQFVCDVYPQGRPSQACRVRPADEELGDVAQGCSAGAGPPGALALAALGRLLGRRRRR